MEATSFVLDGPLESFFSKSEQAELRRLIPEIFSEAATEDKPARDDIEALFSLDLPEREHSAHARTMFNAERLLLFANLFGRMGHNGLAHALASKIKPAAQSFELWNSLWAAMQIELNNAALKGELENLEIIRAELPMILCAMEAEQAARTAMMSVFAEQTNTGADAAIFPGRFDEVLRGLREVPEAYRGFQNRLASNRLRAIVAQSENDYETSLAIAEESEHLLENFPNFDTLSRRGEFALKRTISLLQLNRTDELLRLAPAYEPLLKPNNSGWLSFKEFEFIAQMDTLRFAEARRTIQHVEASAAFQSSTKGLADRWALFGLFADYVNGENFAESTMESIAKESASYRSDKTGFFVWMKLLHILLQIQRGEFESLAEEVEALSKYRTRYLKRHATTQSFALLGLIISLVKNGFDAKITERKNSVLLSKIRIKSSGIPREGIQILPLEWVWEHIKEKTSGRVI